MSDIVEVNSTDVVTIDDENVEIITIAPGDTAAFLVEEDGSTIVSNSSGINFTTNMGVSDDGDGTVTVSWDNTLPGTAWLSFDASTGDWEWRQNADTMLLRWNPDGVGSNTTVWNVDPGTTTITWTDYAHDFNSNNVSNIGTLDVDGAASLNSTLAVTGASTLTGLLTANGGINFGQTDLDYYEEGTWTPVLIGITTAGSHSYDAQSGSYTRIGNIVFFNFNMELSAYDTNADGNARISGLPFSNASGQSREAVDFRVLSGIGTVPTNFGGFVPDVNGNQIRVQYINTSTATDSAFDVDDLGSDTLRIRGSGFYEV